MQTCHFFSKETRTCSDDGRWRADGENQSFHIRKATLLIGQVPAVLCQTLRGLRELAPGRPIFCTCDFPTTTKHISWPCAPLRDETSARRNGAARGAMRKTIVFQLGKHTFRATGPPCRSFVLESLRNSSREKLVFNNALWVCIVAVHRAGHVLRALAATECAPPGCTPSRQLERTNDCSNAVGACKPCCRCWKTGTFRNAPLQRKLTLLQICTFPI